MRYQNFFAGQTISISRTFVAITAIAAALTAGVSSAEAGQLLTYDFSDVAANNNGAAFGEGATIDTHPDWTSQVNWTSTDVAGLGLAGTASNFVRTMNGAAGQTFNVFDTYSLTVSIRANAASYGSNTPLFSFGLTDSLNAGTAQNLAGSQLRADASNFLIQSQNFANEPATQMTGPAYGTGFNTYNVTITKSATPDDFDVTYDFAGTTNSYIVTNATLYAASTVYPFFNSVQVGASGVDLTNFSSAYATHLPEPGTAMLLGLGLIGLVTRRRGR